MTARCLSSARAGGREEILAGLTAVLRFRSGDRKPEIIVHEHCGESGSIGAAVEATRLYRKGRRTSFIGLGAVRNMSYRPTRNEDTRCFFCKNNCLRTFIDVNTGGGGEPKERFHPIQVRPRCADLWGHRRHH